MSDSAMHVIGPILIIVAFLAILEALKAISRKLERSQSPLLNRLPTICLGLLLTVGGFWFWLYLVGGNPINELALIRRGVTAKGVITDLREDVGDDDRGRAVFVHSASYSFRLPNGQTVEAVTGDFSGRAPAYTTPSIEVEYLPDDPAVSRIKGTGCFTVTEWLWKKVGIGGLLLAMFISPGVGLIHWGVRRKPEMPALPSTRKTGPLP